MDLSGHNSATSINAMHPTSFNAQHKFIAKLKIITALHFGIIYG
jgi:hypothetical protein